MSADYSCAICLDSATDPVVTKCGHLYCWPCLDQWLVRQPECPTCKGHIDSEKPGDIIPLYGKGRQSDNKAKGPSTTSTAASSSEPTAAASTGSHTEGTNNNTATASPSSSAADNSSTTSPNNNTSATATHEEQQRQHAFNTRHERPRAQREAPNPANEARRGGRGMGGGMHLGNNGWGGLCVVGAPTLLGDLSLLPIIILVCVAAYYIYKYWQQRGQQNAAAAGGVGQGGGAAQNNHQAPNHAGGPQHANNPTDLSLLPALLVVVIAIFYIFAAAIAVDDDA